MLVVPKPRDPSLPASAVQNQLTLYLNTFLQYTKDHRYLTDAYSLQMSMYFFYSHILLAFQNEGIGMKGIVGIADDFVEENKSL